MAKYMSKNDPSRRPVTGKLWGCSESLSEKNTKIVFDTQNPVENFSLIHNSATTSQREIIIYSKDDTLKERGFYLGELMLFNWKNLLYQARSELKVLVDNVCNTIRKFSNQSQINYNPCQ
jgi:hypothetical protein